MTGRVASDRPPLQTEGQQERLISYDPQQEEMDIASLTRNRPPQQLSQ